MDCFWRRRGFGRLAKAPGEEGSKITPRMENRNCIHGTEDLELLLQPHQLTKERDPEDPRAPWEPGRVQPDEGVHVKIPTETVPFRVGFNRIESWGMTRIN